MDDMWGLESTLNCNFESENCSDGNPAPKKKRFRGPSLTHVQLEESVWGQMLNHPDIDDPTSYVAMKFRLRFRIPYGVFKHVLIPICIKENIFDLVRKSRIPIQFKLLVCLRIIGRGHDFDTVNEITFHVPQNISYIYQ